MKWEARQLCGAQQVVFTLPAASGDPLDATIGECGAMNMFFLIERRQGDCKASGSADGSDYNEASGSMSKSGGCGSTEEAGGGGGAIETNGRHHHAGQLLLPQRRRRLELVTPPLDGTILPGVTRDSVLELCRE